MHVCVCMCVCVCACECVHVYEGVCVCVCMCAHAYECVCVYTCECHLHTYTCANTAAVTSLSKLSHNVYHILFFIYSENFPVSHLFS